jgi:hypothetical protein
VHSLMYYFLKYSVLILFGKVSLRLRLLLGLSIGAEHASMMLEGLSFDVAWGQFLKLFKLVVYFKDSFY